MTVGEACSNCRLSLRHHTTFTAGGQNRDIARNDKLQITREIITYQLRYIVM